MLSFFLSAPFHLPFTPLAILFARYVPFQLESMHADPVGRFLIVQGRVGTLRVMVCKVNSLTTSQLGFLEMVLSHMFRLQTPYTVIAGHFSMPMSPQMDRHFLSVPRAPQQLDRLARRFRQLRRKHRLYDAWRVPNPTGRQFSFYSAPHRMHTRIDTFSSRPQLSAR